MLRGEDKMAEISRDNVEDIFARICGIEAGNAYSELIDRCISKIGSALTVTVLTEEQAASCEYAAACEAAYGYALEAASCERLVMSEDGAVRQGSGSLLTVEGAEALRKHAYAALAGFARLGGFVFETVKEDV